MYSNNKIYEAKKFNKFLLNRNLQNLVQYLYEPNLNSLIFDYVSINKNIEIPIDSKKYSTNEDEIYFMINQLSQYTPNFVYTYGKDDKNLWKEKTDGVLLKKWIRNKESKYINQVLQQIFLSYSLAYDSLGLIPYKSKEISIIDLGEEREIIYQDLSDNYFSFYSQYLVKINGMNMMYKGELMTNKLKNYLIKIGNYDYALTEQGIKNILSDSIKQIFKLTKQYKEYATDEQIYDFYDANAIIELQFDFTDNRYATRSEILKNCLVNVNDTEIFIDGLNQNIRNYKPFLKKYFTPNE